MQGECREMKYFNYPHCDVRSSSTFLDIQCRIKNKPAPDNTGSPAQHSVMTWRGGVRWWEGGSRGRQCISITADLHVAVCQKPTQLCKQLCPVLGCVQLFMTLGLYVACQVPLSTEFFRQEYRSGLPFPSAEDLPDPGIKPAFLASPALQADSLPTEPLEKPIILQLKRKEKEKKNCLSNDLSHWFKNSLLSFIT